MKEGDVVLGPFPQADGKIKNRPAILLRLMPPYGDALVCGVSTQLRQCAIDFDEVIEPANPDFYSSGLKAASLIRLGFLTVLPVKVLSGRIGSIAPERRRRLLAKLCEYLSSQ